MHRDDPVWPILFRAALVAICLVSLDPLVLGAELRIMPPSQSRFLQYQKFDVRIEATGLDDSTSHEFQVLLDDKDITHLGITEAGSNQIESSWTLRAMQLDSPGERTLRAVLTSRSPRGVVLARAESSLSIRPWDGACRACSHRTTATNPQERNVSPAPPGARNVILIIGDGMGVAHRTAARVLSKGYSQGKTRGRLAMDDLPYNGLLMTSSLDSLITDSASSAHSYSTGNKTNNGMEGVFPDSTEADDDNPRLENLAEWAHRYFGMVSGIVSDAYLTDATPAAMIAHSQDRNNGTLIASQYVDELDRTGLRVLLGGGASDFIPQAQQGSTRTDDRHIITELQRKGFELVTTRTDLKSIEAKAPSALLGLFHSGNMSTAFDKLGMGHESVTAGFPDQPFLDEMTSAAIAVLERHPNGFFLMVEGAHIDKQAHQMDGDRSIWDTIQLDHAVAVALAFAKRTNSDADTLNDTLVIVTADHECGGLTLPGVSNRLHDRDERDFVKTYTYSAPRNDTQEPNFTDYADTNGDGYPDGADPRRRLIFNFGASSDRYEDWTADPAPAPPTVIVNGVAVANPNDSDAVSGRWIGGTVENGVTGGVPITTAVHTMSDVPVSAFGPGAFQFARISDNTDVFFYIVDAITGGYVAAAP